MSSNMRFVRTSPTARYCASPDGRCTRASPRRWNITRLIWLRREPEVLARHYAEAGLTEKAAVFWAKAGRHSLARSALAEAEPQLERAIALIADLPGSPAVSKLQKELRADLAKVKAQRDAVSLSSPPPTKHFVVSGD